MRYDKIRAELIKEILAEAARRDWTHRELDAKMGRWEGCWTAIKTGRRRLEVADVIDAARVFGTSPSQLLVRAEFSTEPALLERPAGPDFDLRRVVEELGVLSARIRRVEEQSENGG